MEESKFLEAQNLKNQISYLENWIKDTKRENVKIGVVWKSYQTEYIPNGGLSWNSNEKEITHINELPMYIKDEVIHLVKQELEKLEKKFKLL